MCRVNNASQAYSDPGFSENSLPCLFRRVSRFSMRCSNSTVSIVLTKLVTSAESSPAFSGVRSPRATTDTIAAIALLASPTDFNSGIAKCTGRSRRGGSMRSRQSRKATVSPARASLSTRPNQSSPAAKYTKTGAIGIARTRRRIGIPRSIRIVDAVRRIWTAVPSIRI